MEITWHWNFLETIAALFLFTVGIIALLKILGYIYLWLIFRNR